MSARTLRIRRATRSDQMQIKALQLASICTLGRRFYSPEVIESFIAHVGTMDAAMLDDGTYFLGEMDGELVGCGGWSRRAPTNGSDFGWTHDAASPAWPLARAVYVSPAYARQGIGTRLMETVELDMTMAGITQVALTATLTGVPLYLRMRYRTRGAVTLTLPDGHHFIGIAMDKVLARRQRLAA